MEGGNQQLLPLVRGEPVILSINDPRLRRKKRIPNPMLYITPLSSNGEEVDTLMFSFPGYGCEIIGIEGITASQLYRVGLTFRSATLLTEAVKQVFNHRTVDYDQRKNDPQEGQDHPPSGSG